MPARPAEKGGAMIDHFGFQCTDTKTSAAFYDAVLAPLGGKRIMDFGVAIGYGTEDKPDFWIGGQQTGEGFRESHIGFTASSRDAVRALARGARPALAAAGAAEHRRYRRPMARRDRDIYQDSTHSY